MISAQTERDTEPDPKYSCKPLDEWPGSEELMHPVSFEQIEENMKNSADVPG